MRLTISKWGASQLNKYIFPIALITLDICDGDIEKLVYWFAAATLIATATF